MLGLSALHPLLVRYHSPSTPHRLFRRTMDDMHPTRFMLEVPRMEEFWKEWIARAAPGQAFHHAYRSPSSRDEGSPGTCTPSGITPRQSTTVG